MGNLTAVFLTVAITVAIQSLTVVASTVVAINLTAINLTAINLTVVAINLTINNLIDLMALASQQSTTPSLSMDNSLSMGSLSTPIRLRPTIWGLLRRIRW